MKLFVCGENSANGYIDFRKKFGIIVKFNYNDFDKFGESVEAGEK